MRKSKFTPEQILQALRQAEAGTAVVEICRKLGVTETTFYRWKKHYTGEETLHGIGRQRAPGVEATPGGESATQAPGRRSDTG